MSGVNTETRAYTYDNNGNQLTETVTPYINGIPQTSQVTTNDFDDFGKLISSTQPDDTEVEFAYNGEGRRVEKSVDGTLTRYLNEYDKAVLEVDSSNNQTAKNVYGNNLLARKVGSTVYFYMYNGHADVTALITSNGTISSTYYYDAFGNILDHTGTVSNPFRYAGYMFDDETENYFLNARYYDPKIARFLSEDTYRGDASDPLSLNIYTYCHNNPIVYWDYTGHWEQGDENLTYEARVEISRLTDMWFAATTDEEREWVHAAAVTIRNDPANYAGYEQNSYTGNAVNAILNDDNIYLTPDQWDEISTTKQDAIVEEVLADGIVTPGEVEAVSGINVQNYQETSWSEVDYSTIEVVYVNNPIINMIDANDIHTLGISMIPGVGDAKDLQEAITGYDIITGDKLTATERVLSVVAAIIPVVSGKVLSEAVDTGIGLFNKIFSKADNIAKGAEKVDNFISSNIPQQFQTQVKNAFGSDVKVTTLKKDTTVYRYYGGDSAPSSYWVTPTKVSNPISELALPPGNSAIYVDSIVLKKGTTVLEGSVARNFGQSGGGYQYFVPSIK